MGYPDFLCIGARKAGTTWLHKNLSKHPHVWLPPVKETHYLDHRSPFLLERLFGSASHLRNARAHLRTSFSVYRRGGSFDDLRWAARYCLMPRTDKWYRSLFPISGDDLAGEVCPGYARLPNKKVALVAGRMPKLKIIYLLRDPIECAWSSAGAHFEKKMGAKGIFKASPQQIEHYLAKKNSVSHLDYAENLANWTHFYPDHQIFISYYEDLKASPGETLSRIFQFLGLKETETLIADARRKHGTVEDRRSAEIPRRYLRFLARLYLDSLTELSNRLENENTTRWLAEANKVLNAPSPAP